MANPKGQIVAFDQAAGDHHDLDPVKGEFLDAIAGIFFADSGYVSDSIKQELMGKDILFIAKPKETSTDSCWHFDKYWCKQYRQRQVVEGYFPA